MVDTYHYVFIKTPWNVQRMNSNVIYGLVNNNVSILTHQCIIRITLMQDVDNKGSWVGWSGDVWAERA